jgi:mono/diheme cytochrome c family protein
MKLSLKLKIAILGMLSGMAAFSLACAAENSSTPVVPGATEALVVPSVGTPERRGYDLFMLNCAHCHGTDARGDEGPDLHGLTKSNARIALLIKNGIKGEMPKFAAKLTDSDIQSLTAFVRSLKE